MPSLLSTPRRTLACALALSRCAHAANTGSANAVTETLEASDFGRSKYRLSAWRADVTLRSPTTRTGVP
jgi:hypothetical protein